MDMVRSWWDGFEATEKHDFKLANKMKVLKRSDGMEHTCIWQHKEEETRSAGEIVQNGQRGRT